MRHAKIASQRAQAQRFDTLLGNDMRGTVEQFLTQISVMIGQGNALCWRRQHKS